ncbi:MULTISPECIES: hypothetical protein [Streptomyces]|uniref:Uncharacterized protein n=1 Tax=Streptomyces lonegramiae TaxID=3075524 RepID=A0ABU2XMY5_9ACTN|nr:hypothetical protein [Streptomyces sp. DSM 41529]MDT0547182.1 hypothetical protein [Streptomyces sp. DSM 41529]
MVDVPHRLRPVGRTYEQTVEDVMDLALLDELTERDWPSVRRVMVKN